MISTMIKLNQYETNDAVWVNPNHIIEMSARDYGSFLNLTYGSLMVTEKPEFINRRIQYESDNLQRVLIEEK